MTQISLQENDNKLDGIEAGATADQTDAEIRAAVEAATDSNVFTDAESLKLFGIATGANNYAHPTGNGNNHVPSGGSSGEFLGYSSAGTAAWVTSPSTSTTAGAVGTYTWLYHNNNTLSAGATVSGSTLRDHSGNDYAATHTHWPSSSVLYNYGTWRNMTGDSGYANSTYGSPTLFVRVS